VVAKEKREFMKLEPGVRWQGRSWADCRQLVPKPPVPRAARADAADRASKQGDEAH